MCNSTAETTLFKAIFKTAYLGCFRIGELLAFNRHTSSPLQRRDVMIESDAIIITLQQSKSSQRQPQRVQIALNDYVSRSLCRTLQKVLRTNGSADSPFFAHSDGSPATLYQARAILQKAADHSGLNQKISLHCFRISGATHYAQQGLSEKDLQHKGRWRSSAYKKYIRRPT